MALNDFTQYALENVSVTNPTSLEFGIDGRLYVTQQNGLIKALEIEKQPEGGYTVVSEESITLVKDMPNHNDDGSLAANVLGRQVTGVVTTTNELGQVVLYVSSSDSRIAGGSSGNDADLDTNSGVISRLTLTPTGWEKVDIVRGLPRSEENHSVNGMQLTEINGVPTLLVAVGGNTNQGAQSNNFSHTNEYYYSASVVAIDLAKIDALEAQGLKTYAPPGYAEQDYIFDLPTLDDPTRANGANGADLAESGTAGGDPFGGNDGLNQAIYDPTGVVKVYSSGYRNIYDVVVTEDGKLYTYDNGPNSGWGGLPVNANGQVIVDANGDGVPDNGPATTMRDVTASNNAGTSKPDQLHLIDPTIHDGSGTSYIDGTPYNSNVYLSQGLGYYGGHPNLTRAYGTQAGLYLYSETGQPLTIVNGELVVSTTGPVDLGPMIANWNDIVGQDGQGNEFIDPRQAIYLSPNPNDGSLPFDGSLHSIGSSTNGITEYVFNGSDINKALLTVSFNGNLTALILDADGKVIGTQTRGIGGNPLDVTSQKDGEIFGGTIWVATHGSDKIFILDPDSGQGIVPDPTDRDVDDVEDTFDPFAADPSNGLDNVINANETLTWEFVPGAPFPNQSPDLFDGATGLYNGFDIGFTGIMTDGTGLPESFFNPENLIAGGAPGAFQIKKVEAGDPFADNLRGGYQFGIVPGGDTGVFTVTTQMDSYFDEIAAGIPANAKLLQGLFVGSGDMDNFVYIAAVRQANGTTGIEVAWEFEQPFQPNATGSAFYQIDALGAATGSDNIKVSFAVDSETGIVTPKWEFTSGGQTFTQDDFTGPIQSVQLAGKALDALHGQNDLDKKSGGTVESGFAVGILASNSAGGAVEGNIVAAVNAGGNDYTTIVNGQSVTFLSDKVGGAANPWVTGAYKSFTPSTTFDIQGTDLDTLHLSERSQTGTWGYAVPVVNGGTYDLDLYFAEIYFGAPGGAAGGIGKREFKIKVEGQYVDIPGLADGKLDIYELVGAAKELVLSYDITENANDGNSTLDIQFETVTNQAKLSGLIIREGSSVPTFAADWENITVTGQPKDLTSDQTPPTVSLTVIPAPADDAQFQVTVVFTDGIAMNPGSVTATDLTMSGPTAGELVDFQKTVSADGKTVTATYSFAPVGGAWLDGGYAFQVAAGAGQDAAGNGNVFSSASIAYGSGPAPGQDLDGDGVANQDDADVDGDGQLNGADAFHYDTAADGHGTPLADAQVLLFDFNTNGTPYQNGLTGLMLNTNGTLDEQTGTGKVENGKLVITATNGDYRQTDNTQKDAYLTGIRRDGGFTVETAFAVPDFNPTDANPDTKAVDFQSLGVAVSLNQNNVVKLVFGNNGAEQFQLINESNGVAQAGQKKLALPTNITYTDITDVKLTLEIAVNDATNAVSAIASAVLLGAGGSQLASLVIGTVPIVGSLAAAIIDPALAVGVGVVQTSFSGKPQFTAAYDYLKITASGADQPPTVGNGIAAQAATEDQAFAFVVPPDAFADDTGAANLVLSATLVDGSPLPSWLTFNQATKTFTGTPANGNVGILSVKVVASDALAQTVETVFQLTIANTNDAPTAIALGANTVRENQAGAVIGAVQVTDPDVGDTFTYEVSEGAAISTRFEVDATGQLKLKAGVSLDAETEPTVNVTVKATDSGGQAISQGFIINVTDPYAPTGDLDLDGILNSSDTDIDGDGLANGDDTFAYDSDDDGHGVLMTAGQVIRLDFNNAGTPYQNGFTGVMASSNAAFKSEDTGVGSVSGGKLHVTTTSGDTGGANTPQNNYQLGIKNGSFTIEGVFGNPYFGTGEVPNNFEQLGLQISVHSDAFAKLVFGSPGSNIEFSQDGGTPIRSSFANGKTLSDFAQAKLEMAVSTVGTTSTATATITLLDANGNTIPGGGPTVVGTMTLAPTLAAALQDGTQAVGVGVTSTHVGGDAFAWSMDHFQVKEGVQVPTPLDAEEILAAQTDLVTTDTYSGTAVGAAVLKILPDNFDVQTSNFGSNSFTLQNVGDKKIAGVFIDVSSAIYGDSVFDSDGSGGDSVFKDIAFDTSAGTGAINPSTYGHFFFPARDPAVPDPLFNNALSNSGKGADGGYRGLLLKFSNTSDGFQTGEMVGFSGDMDPNSIAGLLKSTVDGNSVPAWDVGGVSGAELIGSRLTIMFTDGTMASGQLMGDGSQAGAQALITQSTSGAGQVAGLTVNGVQPGGTGTYGGSLPEVILTGPAGATVRVVMTRGFDPVESQTPLNGGATTADELVEDRLARYDFKVNNAADFQTVDVVIPASGSIDISQMFKYKTAPNVYTGIPDYNKLPVGFVAAVIDPGNGGLPVGAVTQPIYLQNNGTPVQVDGTGQVPSTYYQMVGNRLKVQVEDAAGGANPPAGWVFQNDADGGNQTGFQGSGYYYWKSETGTAVNTPEGGFTVSFHVETAGTYTLRARSSRDSNTPSGDRNDVWVKIDHDAEALLPAGTANIVSNGGFVKLFGASTGWGFSSTLDTASDAAPNVAAKFNLSAGFHTITFAGRAEGYHFDFFELYQGTAPAIGASNSPLITGGGGPSGSTSASVAAGNGDIEISTLPTGVLAANLTSANLEFGTDNYGSNDPAEPQKVNVVGMRFTGLNLPAGTEITDAYLEFQAYATNSVASDFEISIQNSLTGGVFTTTVSNFTGRSFVGGVDWVPEAWVAGQTYRTPDISGLIEQVIGSGGLDAADVLVFRVTGTGVREAHSFEASGAQPALRINYGGSGNVAPTDISLSNQSVTEEQAGAVVGNVSVVDPNVGNTHTFTVNDNRFEVVGGQLKLKSGISLDFETQPSVSVVVTATDNGGLSLSETFVIGVIDDPGDNGGGLTFTATVVNANGDIEQGSSITSPDLETNKTIGIQFTVPAGIDLAAGALIESAVISWVSERTHTANSTLTFAVESQLNGAALSTGVTNRTYLPETEVWNASGTWTDGQEIAVGIDLANQLNALIQSGGLHAGDVVTVKVTGTGGVRYIEAAGGGRTPAELTITVAEAGFAALSASSQKLAFADSGVRTDTFSARGQENFDDADHSDMSRGTDRSWIDWFDRDGTDFHGHDWMDGHGNNADDHPFIA